MNYTSPTGRYSILVPNEPQLTTQEATAPSGDKVTQYMAIASDSPATYLVTYFDFPASTVSFSLDKARDGMVASTKGTLLSENSASLGGYSGREVKISMKSNDDYMIIRARFCDVKRRIYVVQFIVGKANDTKEAAGKAKKYFDSFKVVKAP